MQKLYDLAVKTGEYMKDGEPKGRYENVGSVMQGDNGQFLILKRTFNPAGVPNPDNKDSCIVSCFEPKDAGGQPPQQGYQQPPPYGQAPAAPQPQYQQPAPAPQQGYQQPPQGGYPQK